MSKIEFSKINREEFYVTDVEVKDIGACVLVCPRKNKYKWTEDEFHLRSLLCLADGTVISAGFPKFQDRGMFGKHDLITNRGISLGETIITHKLDGSLIIRSVYNGVVIFRTRGSHQLGDFEEPVMELVEGTKLLDPTIYADVNVLMEYTSPDNQVVLRYSDAKLYLLGFSKFEWTRAGAPVLRLIEGWPAYADLLGIPAAPRESAVGTPEEIQKAVDALEKKEGFVTWTIHLEVTDNEHYPTYVLQRWKTEWYRKMHGLRSQATPRYMREFVLKHDVHNIWSFYDAMKTCGYEDKEVISALETEAFDMIERFLSISDVASQARTAATLASRDFIDVPGSDKARRKLQVAAFQKIAKDLENDWIFGYLIAFYDGKGADRFIIAGQYLDEPVPSVRLHKDELIPAKSEWCDP